MTELTEVHREWLAGLARFVGEVLPATKARSVEPAAPGGLPNSSTYEPATIADAPASVFSTQNRSFALDAPTTPAKAGAGTPLDSAISQWAQVRSRLTAGVSQLTSAILTAFVGEAPALVADLQKKVTRLDGLAKAFDPSLAEALNKVTTTVDAAGRRKAMVAARAVLDKFRAHLKSQDKLLTEIDANPFGVKLSLKQDIASSLAQVDQAVH